MMNFNVKMLAIVTTGLVSMLFTTGCAETKVSSVSNYTSHSSAPATSSWGNVELESSGGVLAN